MLYIYGTARSGKTLLGNAIEMQAATARPSTAGGNYNSHYAKGLILIYDDVQPISYGNHGQMKRALGEFLNVLSGQQVEVHEKYKDARGLQYPWRVVVLNNSSAFFDDLMQSHNSHSDRDKRDALARRSILLKVNPLCREWLFEHARGRAEVVSEVAAHIAWMNQNRDELRPIFSEYEKLAEPGGMRLVSNRLAMGTAESSQSLDEVQMIGAVVRQLSKCLEVKHAQRQLRDLGPIGADPGCSWSVDGGTWGQGSDKLAKVPHEASHWLDHEPVRGQCYPRHCDAESR